MVDDARGFFLFVEDKAKIGGILGEEGGLGAMRGD